QIYRGCKDLNEYLQQQRAGKQAEAIRMKAETASRQKGKEATGEEPAKRGRGLSM
ncbi:DNA primase, partial [Phocaeicola plebeius]